VGNLAAFVRIDAGGEMKFTTFEAQPHPDVKVCFFFLLFETGSEKKEYRG
jgi:hypothetical protein